MTRRALVAGLLACAAATLARTETPKPQRVASINLSADEVLVAILPQERLVSVTR